jgi:hypothetical protein
VRFRLLALCLAIASLAACNDVIGDENGGVIQHFVMRDDTGRYDDFLPRVLVSFRNQHIPSRTDMLQIAVSHCMRYGRSARITGFSKEKIHFECVSQSGG